MKRLTALMGCLLLLLSMALGARAQELPYSDTHAIRNTDAVAMLTDLQLLEGDDNREFHPSTYLTRAEAAKIAALVVCADPVPTIAAPFGDIDGSWAKDYISFGYEQGYLDGGSDCFQPDEPVTARELVKMLLGAIGYDFSAMEDPEQSLDALAEELRVYNGYELDYNQPISRDYAARLIINVLGCSVVTGYENGEPVYLEDDLLNPVSALEHRFGVIRYQQVITANEYADLESPNAPLEEGMTKLYGHYPMRFGSNLAALGRTVTVYLRDGQLVGVPMYDPEEFCVTVSGQEAVDTLLVNGGYTLAQEGKVYDNAVLSDAGALQSIAQTDTVTFIDYESDGAIDLALIYRWQAYEVLQSSPLVISTPEGNQVFPNQSIAPAEELYALCIGGRWTLKTQ